jgi:hypothetical protein
MIYCLLNFAFLNRRELGGTTALVFPFPADALMCEAFDECLLNARKNSEE